MKATITRYMVYISLFSVNFAFTSIRRNPNILRSCQLLASNIGTTELVKLFGRLADKQLLLDVEGAGTPEMMNCCHGGCDNCNYSRVFDNMAAGRPKWIAMYSDRQLVDGRRHVSKWSQLFCDECSTLEKEMFIERLKNLSYQSCLGPSISVDPNDLPTEDTLNSLWDILTRYATEPTEKTIIEMSSNNMVEALRSFIQSEHGATWTEWLSAWEREGC